MNLYTCNTKKFSYYVLANDPNEARDKVETMLNIADYGFRDEREVNVINLIAKEITEFPVGKPNFSSGNKLIL